MCSLSEHRTFCHAKNSRLMKLMFISAVISIFLALIILNRAGSAIGYEASLYSAYPWYFWFLICASISCGILILINQAFAERRSNWWLAGLGIVVFANLIVILLPVLRGYFISDLADEVSHLGMIKDIAVTGHLGNSNVYPISHILAITLSYVSGINSRLVIKIMPAIFYVIYMVGLYLWVLSMKRGFGQVLLVMAFGSVLLFTYFNYLFLPTQFFLYFVPFVLMLHQKKNTSSHKLEYGIIFIVVLIFMPFVHPLGSIFLIAFFLIFEISKVIYDFILRKGYLHDRLNYHSLKINLVPTLILFITFTTWFSYFAIFRWTIARAYESFIYGYGESPIETMVGQIQMANLGFYNFIDMLIKTNGHDIIFALLSTIAIFIILRKVYSSKSCLKVEEIFLSLIFSVFSLFYISTLLGSFICTGRSIRIFCWALMASVVLNGIVFHEQTSRLRNKKFKACVCILAIILISSAIIGIFSMFPSPYIKQANLQVTEKDWGGTEWFFEHKNSDKTLGVSDLTIRAPAYIFGYDTPKPETVGYIYPPPPHFGYMGDETLAHSFNSDTYIVITERDKVVYTELWPKFWPKYAKITPNDFNRLCFDSSVNKVYFNGELEIWKISTTKK